MARDLDLTLDRVIPRAIVQTVATARIAPKNAKICQGQPNKVLRVFQISSKSVHFRRCYSRTREHRFFTP